MVTTRRSQKNLPTTEHPKQKQQQRTTQPKQRAEEKSLSPTNQQQPPLENYEEATTVVHCCGGRYCTNGLVIHGKVAHHCSKCKLPCHGILCGVPKSPSDETFGQCFSCSFVDGEWSPRNTSSLKGDDSDGIDHIKRALGLLPKVDTISNALSSVAVSSNRATARQKSGISNDSESVFDGCTKPLATSSNHLPTAKDKPTMLNSDKSNEDNIEGSHDRTCDGSKESVVNFLVKESTADSNDGLSKVTADGITAMLCGLCIGGAEVDMDEEEAEPSMTWISIGVPFPAGAVGFSLRSIVDGPKAGFFAVTKVNEGVCPQKNFIFVGDVLVEIDGWSVHGKLVSDVKAQLDQTSNKKHRILKFDRSAQPATSLPNVTRRGPKKATQKHTTPSSEEHASRLFDTESSRLLADKFQKQGYQTNTRRRTKAKPTKLSHLKDPIATKKKTDLVRSFFNFAEMATPVARIDGTVTSSWPKILSCMLLYDPYVIINERGGRRSGRNMNKQLRTTPILAIALHSEDSLESLQPVISSIAELDWTQSLGDGEVVRCENSNFDICFANTKEAAIHFMEESAESDPSFDLSVFEPVGRVSDWKQQKSGVKATKLSHLQGGRLSGALGQCYEKLFAYQDSVCPDIDTAASKLPSINVVHILVQPFCHRSKKGGPRAMIDLVRLKPLIVVTASEGSLETIDPIIKSLVSTNEDSGETTCGVKVEVGNNEDDFLLMTQPKPAKKVAGQNPLGVGATPERLRSNFRPVVYSDDMSEDDDESE